MKKLILLGAMAIFNAAPAGADEIDCAQILPPVDEITARLSTIEDRETFYRSFSVADPADGHSPEWHCFIEAIRRDEKFLTAVQAISNRQYFGYLPDLDEALSLVLIDHPDKVLSLISRSIEPEKTVERVCRPYLSAEDPPADWRKLLKLQKKSVTKVAAPELSETRQLCLQQLKTVERTIKK